MTAARHLVALGDCQDYTQDRVDAAVRATMDLVEVPAVAGATVLLKPNLLNASDPARAATTHPAMLRAAIREFRRRGAARILVGDSPGWQPQDLVGAKTGILEVVREEGAVWADFSESTGVEAPGGALIRRFELAKPLAEADIVVTLPKLKTHQLMYYTGAVKNLFGAIPGFQKSAFHMRLPGRTEFATMLADLMLAAKPAFALMDAVVAMEGHGPNSGTPRQLGLVMASPSSFALDWVAAKLIGYDPADVPYLGLAARDRRYGFDPALVATAGEDPAARAPRHFQLIHVLGENDIIRSAVPGWLHKALKSMMVPKPVFSDRRCVRCAGCVRICPAKALRFEGSKGAPKIDYKACIRCYCCDEVCPEDAISLRRGPF